MALQPEWVAFGEPWVVGGALATLLGGSILTVLVARKTQKGMAPLVGLFFVCAGCVCIVGGILAMHGNVGGP